MGKIDSLQNLRMDSLNKSVQALSDSISVGLHHIQQSVVDSGVILPVIRAVVNKEKTIWDYAPVWSTVISLLAVIATCIITIVNLKAGKDNLQTNIENDKEKERIKKSDERTKERNRIIELWNLVESWTNQTLKSGEQFIHVVRQHREQLASIYNEIDFKKVNFDISMITSISNADLYKIFISKRQKKDWEVIYYFYDFMHSLHNLDKLNNDYQNGLLTIASSLKAFEERIASVNKLISEEEERLQHLILDITAEFHKVKDLDGHDDNKKKSKLFWEANNKYNHVKMFGAYNSLTDSFEGFNSIPRITDEERAERMALDYSKVIKTFPDEVRSEFKNLDGLHNRFLDIKDEMIAYYKKRHGQADEMTRNIQQSLSDLEGLLAHFKMERNQFIPADEF